MSQQEDALRRGAAIVVGTPGRIHDHIRRGNLKLDQCLFHRLDNAEIAASRTPGDISRPHVKSFVIHSFLVNSK